VGAYVTGRTTVQALGYKRRATLVRARTPLQQSLTDLDSLQDDVDALLTQCHQTTCKKERALKAEAKPLGWTNQVRRCQAIPGVGLLTVLATVATYHRGQFRSADSFIAFMGMNVRVRDSGKYQRRRKLTKKRGFRVAPFTVQRRHAGPTQCAAGTLLSGF